MEHCDIAAGILTPQELTSLWMSVSVSILSSLGTFSIFFFWSTVHFALTAFSFVKDSFCFLFALFAYLKARPTICFASVFDHRFVDANPIPPSAIILTQYPLSTAEAYASRFPFLRMILSDVWVWPLTSTYSVSLVCAYLSV